MYPYSLEKLIECFKCLPGIGDKSAERMAFSVLNFSEEKLDLFIASLSGVKSIRKCSICNNISDNEHCFICSDINRDRSTIFVVEKPKDIVLFEKMGNYKGMYHVLGGLISPLEGINPSDISIDSLVERIKKDNVKEVIIVLKPSIEGETTTQYIKKILTGYNVKITKIPIGIPMGTDIEYIDSMTLEMAFEDRKNIE